MAREAMDDYGRMFASAKGKKQKVIDYIPYYLSGCRVHIFLEIAVCLLLTH